MSQHQYPTGIQLSGLSSQEEGNNEYIGSWNDDKGESVEVENSPLKSTRLIRLEKRELLICALANFASNFDEHKSHRFLLLVVTHLPSFCLATHLKGKA